MNTPVNKVLISNSSSGNTSSSLEAIATDDILVLDAKGQIIDITSFSATENYGTIKIAQGVSAGNAIYSDPINTRKIKKISITNYVAPTELVYQIGTSTGLFPAAPKSATDYFLDIISKTRNNMAPQHPRRTFYQTTGTVSGTRLDDDYALALNFVNQINSDGDASKDVIANIVGTGHTVQAIGYTIGTGTNNLVIKVTNNSKVVTISIAAKSGVTPAVTGLAVDNFLCFDNLNTYTASTHVTNNMTALPVAGDPIYKIVSITPIPTTGAADGALLVTITLDRPYQGITQTLTSSIASANSVSGLSADYVRKVTGTTSAYNITIKGKLVTNTIYANTTTINDYLKANFDVTCYEDTNNTMTNSTNSAVKTVVQGLGMGIGWYEQVRALETEMQGNMGIVARTDFYHVVPTYITSPTSDYSLISITHDSEIGVGLGNANQDQHTTVIAINQLDLNTGSTTKGKYLKDWFISLQSTLGLY